MRVVVQRVLEAAVEVAGETVGQIGLGLLVLLGVETDDREADAEVVARKLSELRIFEDSAGKANLGIEEVGGAFLVVSQFTLAASVAKGRRPSFDRAAKPEIAQELVEAVLRGLRQLGHRVETGRFRAAMKVHLVNDGPMTIVFQSSQGKIQP